MRPRPDQIMQTEPFRGKGRPRGLDVGDIQFAYHSMPIISIHIPKTGGTTFAELLGKHYRSRLLLDYGLPIESSVLEMEKGNYECVHGHFVSDKYASVNCAQYVVWLRDPIQRLFSQYYFWKRHQFPQSRAWTRFHAENWSFADFALSPVFRNEQSKYVGHLDIRRMKIVGITERFGESMELFHRELGMIIDISQIPKRRQNWNAGAGESYELHDEKLKQAILDYHGSDHELYLKGLEHFRQKSDEV